MSDDEDHEQLDSATFSKEDLSDHDYELHLTELSLSNRTPQDSYCSDPEGQSNHSEKSEESPESEEESSNNFQVLYDKLQPSFTLSQSRITMPILTKYEKARIIGNRAAQICSNSVIYLFLDSSELKSMTPLEIAEMELEKKVIPFTIRRFMPNGTFEEWNVSELDC